MEHYVICIWNGSLSEDHHFITDYFNTIFPDVFPLQNIVHFDEEIAILLKPISKYIAVLNTCKEKETVEWLDLNISDIISEETIKDDCKSEFLSKDIIEQISSALHSLADQLPAFGTYKLDVLLDSTVLRNLAVRKEPVLAGAFIRLTRWHSAHFTIFEKSKCDPDNLNEWCEIINAHVLHQHSKLDLGPILWRGAVSANIVDKTFYDGFELKLDIKDKYHVFDSSKNNRKQDFSVHIALSSKLQIINEVSFASIPPYLFSPLTFRLCLGRLNVVNEKSFRFVDYLLTNKEAALIMRLEYAEINTKTKPEKKYCTSRWQKAISSHCLRDPQCFVSSFEKFITFAVAKSKNSDHIIAYPLQKSTLDANFYFTLINHRVPSLSLKEKPIETNERILAEVPFVDGDVFQKTLSEYVNQKVQLLKKGSLASNAESNSDFSSFLETIRNFVTSSSSGTVSSSSFSLEETDPSDWPERIQLLYKQMQNETKECIPANVGQSLKLPQQSFSLSTDFIAQYFLPSGEHKNLTNVESICQLKTDHLVTYDFNQVLNSKWPDMMNCVYHDIYYNSDLQAEDKECLGSQMVKLYVQHETASTCNNQQIIQNFSIIVPEKSSTPRKEFRSPSCRAANSVNRKRHENNISPRKNFLKDLITSKILSSSRTLYGANSTKVKESVTNAKSKKNNNKCLVPVRCSPRKKKPVNYKYPSVNKNENNTKNSKNHTSNNMSDLLRKKMRHAVATALENNGINMSHAFFKPCGSKLFSICKTFLDDLTLKKGKTSEYLQKIADAHVKQVIEFYQS